MNEARSARKTGLPSLVLLVALVLALTPMAAFGTLRVPNEEEARNTLTTDIRSSKPAYVVGRHAEIMVTVTRAVELSPRNALEFYAGSPVEGAEVLLRVSIGEHDLYQAGVTDENGRALLRVRLARSIPIGAADVTAFVTKEHLRLDCVERCGGVEEWGSAEVDRLFSVTK
jgi:hypothetical protein